MDGILASNRSKIEYNEESYIERFFKKQKENWYNYDENGLRVKNESENTISEFQMIELDEKVIILSGIPGIGKTTLLPSISKKIKSKNLSTWIEIIKLTDYITVLPEYNSNEDPIDFLSIKVLKYDKIVDQQFKQKIEKKNNVIIMFDGFDELSPDCRETFHILNDNLVRTNISQIWITTRPIDFHHLAQRFSTCSYNLMKFSNNDQIQYFNHYWNSDDIEFTKKIIKNLENRRIDTGIPLLTKLAVEYLVKNYLCKDEMLSVELTTTDLYSRIVRTKGEIDSKLVSSKSNLFDIINEIYDEEPNFYHRSFAEYIIAKFLFKKLTDESSDIDDKFIELLMTEILVNEEFEKIRKFLNDFLCSVRLSKNLYEKLSNKFFIFFENNPKGIWVDRYYDEICIFEFIYESVRLFNPENTEKFREYFPAFFSYLGHYSQNLTFLGKILDENAEVLKNNLNYDVYFREILQLDSVSVLDKYLKALEKQLSNEDLEIFLTSKSRGYFNRTFLFSLSENCTEYFFNYLNKKCHDLKSLLISNDDKEDTFLSNCNCSENSINWIKNNLDDKFYNLCLRLLDRPTNLKTPENKFIYNFKEITKSKIFDFKFSNEMYLESLIKNYTKAVTITIYNLKGEFITSFEDKMKHVNENIRKAGEEEQIDMLVEVLKFYINLFSSRKQDFMKNLNPPFNLLTFEELVMCLSNNIKSFPEKLKAHIIIIGKVCILLRYVNNFIIKNDVDEWPLPELDEKNKFKIQLMEELLKIYEIDDKLKLEGILGVVDNQERLRNIMNKIEYCFEKKYLLQVIQLLITEPYSEYFYQNPLIAEYCFSLFMKIIYPNTY